MRINTNVGALNASKNLFMVQREVDSSMAKLSSGLRINKAGDDAAGLAIANNLRASTRALTQAVNNAEQGNAMLQIAEGSANQIQAILERQKELYIQFSSSQNSTQTAVLNSEFSTLSDEVTRIIDATNFQGQAIFGQNNTFTVGDAGGATISVSIDLTSATVSAGATVVDVATQISAVNAALASIGAAQNRLAYTVANLRTAIVNQAAAESTIRDVDMASEMAKFTKNNVLSQAGTAMLAQANQSGQSILSLLR